MDPHLLMMVGLGGVALIAVVLALFPGLFTDSKAGQRQKAIEDRPSRAGAVAVARDTGARRKQVADSLKDVENRSKSKSVPLDVRLAQAGLDWSPKRYWTVAAVTGLGLGLVLFLFGASPLIAAAGVGVGVLGLPRWFLARRRAKRLKQFRRAFPDALDMVTRGVKAGLPLGDCLRMIAREAAEPVRSEFLALIQAQGIGLTVSEAVDRMAERIPISEASFFAIVINIQQKAGGNLSEALGNLSKVLRDRKKMEGKIKAMSSEAKASAGIIGSLPIAVGFLVYLSSPAYISLLWTTDTGRMVMMGSLFWMSIGVLVIKKMISFDF